MENTLREIWGVFCDVIKWLFVSIYALVLSAINPIIGTIELLLGFAFFDFVAGFAANRKKGGVFRLSKMFNAFVKLIVYFALIMLINQSMVTYNEMAKAEVLVKYVSWFACVMYLINILKNLCILFPNSKGFNILYRVMTVDFKDYITNYIKNNLPK